MGDRGVSGTPVLAAYVLALGRATIGLTFAFSAVGKLRNPRVFRTAVSDFALVPRRWSARVADAVIATELAVVVLAGLGGPALLPGFVLAVGLLAILSGALVLALLRGVRTPCNCFGPSTRRISPHDVVRNVLLLGCGLAGVWALHAARARLGGLEAALTVVMAIWLVVLLANLHEVATTLLRPFDPIEG